MRTALQALAAVLGGTQSLHTNSLDEAYALPSEHAVTIALRTQQVIAYESGVPAVPDPLGGSYFIESLTAEMEKRANDYIRRIDEMGGMIPAIERGFPQTEIANASFEYQHSIETGEQKIVGVNAFVEQNEEPIELLQIDESSAQHQLEKLAKLKSRRDNQKVQQYAGRSAPRRRGPRKHHALHSGCGARLRDAGRDLRCFSRSFRHLYRDRGSIIRTRSQRQLCTRRDRDQRPSMKPART